MNLEMLRTKTENMASDEITRLLYVDDATQALNRRAFEASDHDGPLAIVDMDSLKWINDNMGYRYGDKAIGQLAALLIKTFPGKVYRLGGDEFVIEGDLKYPILCELVKAQLFAKGEYIESDGFHYINSCSFSFGIGESLQEADTMLRKEKIAREASGWRAGRGETPPGASEK